MEEKDKKLLLTEEDFDLAELKKRVWSPEDGAVVFFNGVVRNKNKGKRVKRLELQRYEGMTESELEKVKEEAINNFKINDILIVHRYGELEVGDNIVGIVASSPHREDAFEACKYCIDRLKEKVPLWKKETAEDGESQWLKEGGSSMGMVDISGKNNVPRSAKAEGKIELSTKSIETIEERKVKKGDVFQVAEISAIQAVKDTPNMLPHCHPIPIEGIDVNFDILGVDTIKVVCEVKAVYKTGVEMEALAGVNAALLTIWDMVKYIEKDEDGQYPTTRINDIMVKEKIKGEKDGS